MTSGTAKFGEEAKQEILDKPDSSHSSIMEDGSTLHLNQAAGVVEVDSDSSTHAISVADVEPKDTVKFNSSVVKRWLNIGACDDRSFMFMGEARREG